MTLGPEEIKLIPVTTYFAKRSILQDTFDIFAKGEAEPVVKYLFIEQVREAIPALNSGAVTPQAYREARWAEEEAQQSPVCECEQDWNCPLHGGTSRPTWIETRYDSEPDDR